MLVGQEVVALSTTDVVRKNRQKGKQVLEIYIDRYTYLQE